MKISIIILLIMNNKDQINNILKQAKKIRAQNRTSCLHLENYLYYQELKVFDQSQSMWSCGLCSNQSPQVNKSFKLAYKKLNKYEKAQFYLMNVKHVQKFLATNQNKTDIENQIELKSFIYETIRKKVYLKGGYLIKKWKEVTIQIFGRQNLIRIVDTKEQIELQYYLLRRSSDKESMTLIFEPVEEKQQKFKMSQSSMDFQDLQKSIYQAWQESQYCVIKRMLMVDSKYPIKIKKQRVKSLQSNIDIKNSEVLTLKLTKNNSSKMQRQSLKKELQLAQIQEQAEIQPMKSIKIQKELVSNQIIQGLSSLKDYQQQSYGVYYHKNKKKVRKIFTFSSQIASEKLIIQVISQIRHIKNRKDNVTNVRVLSSIPSQQTNIYYEINSINSEKCQFIYFRHFFVRNNCSYFIEKSVDGETFYLSKSSQTNRAQILYCIWRIRTYGNTIELLVEAEIAYPKSIKNVQQATSQYIGQFVYYVNNQCEGNSSFNLENIETLDFQNQYLSSLSDNEGDFYTVTGSFDFGEHQSFLESPTKFPSLSKKKASEMEISYEPIDHIGSEDVHITKQEIIMQGNYLHHKYPIYPLQKKQPYYSFCETGHPIWGNQWTISKQGYLVNINHEKIKIQSSVLKLVIQRMGKNLIAGKSILNMSLPIQIFGTDSNLERLVKGFIYAPRFIEKAAVMDSPLDRLKQIVCYSLGFSISYIQMEKPFNPILGETYQGLIDGCPVYGEQISHHPPISSVYMQGRGYIIYGNYEAKIQMGLNSASGINQGFSHIKFDNYSTVRFNNPPGQISGLVYGNRKLSLVKKSYFIDEENRLFAQITWGKNKSAKPGYKQYQDYFSGKIVKIKEGFDFSDYKKIKSSFYQEQLGEIYGRMNEKVFFQDEELYDISRDLPFIMNDYFPCLQSDSRMRKDIIVRKTNNFQGAQDAKQELQQIQRNDRKLRK